MWLYIRAEVRVPRHQRVVVCSGWRTVNVARNSVEAPSCEGRRRHGYWTTRGLPTRGLDDSQTGQLAD